MNRILIILMTILSFMTAVTACHSRKDDKEETFRPIYHHALLYGWMNGANGLVYKDGEYHLYFQFNPYGFIEGNKHWGHSVSKDLVHWEHLNPILRPADDLKDFRNPKVLWYAPKDKWIMIVSSDSEMRFYDSKNLKDWNYMSSFGESYGIQPYRFECPDMVELPVGGNSNHKRWALIVNVNPGYNCGGSTTQYFIGDFDGTKFICDNRPNVTKLLDWGKDHHTTVCFSNTVDRVIAFPWITHWQYSNIVSNEQFRSTNALPRELRLYTQDGEVYLSSTPIKELKALRKESKTIPAFTVQNDYNIDALLSNNEGAYELSLEFTSGNAEIIGFCLFNDKGEKVDIYFNLLEKKLVMDRTNSGATWAPIRKSNKYKLDIFVDKCSVEIFLNGGEVAMTNLVFPTEPYNRMNLFSKGGTYKVDSFHIHRLGL